jgi:choline-sulfatase
VKPRLEDKFRRPAGQIDALPAQHFPITEDKVIRIRRAYAAKLALIDDQIGALVKAIADRGDLDTTLIVLTSDHGEFAGDYGLMYKSAFMDSAVRIPLLVCAPSFPSTHGSHSSAHIELMDVGAFLAGAANPDASPHGHARSFAPCIEKGDPSHRSFSVSELKGELMYFDDDWKLAVNVDAQPYLLFDRRRDPSEGENLAGDPKLANVRRDLTVKLLRHLLLTRTIPAQG